MPTENKPAEPWLSFNTPDAGRTYIAKLFETVLRRHDYRQYIAERLAGDFACTLAQYLEERTAREQALQQRLTAADQRIDDLLGRARGLIIQAHASLGFTENHPDCIRDLAALNPTTENPQ